MSTLVEVNTEYENEYVYSKIQYDVRHEWRNHKRFLNIDDGSYYQGRYCAENNGYNIISFEEFKSRYELKIGDTFEHNGFICEVKEKIEEKNWYRIIDRIGNLYFEKMPKERAKQAVDYEVKSITEITNQEFIKQLEENAR